MLHCAALLPMAVAGLIATSAGRSRSAAGWWLRLRGRPEPLRRSGALVVAGHTVLSLVLGAVALVPFGVLAAFVFRGVLYGWVDPGPYDTAWGGPTRAGAWAAHFLIGLPMAAVAVLLLAGLSAVHDRLTGIFTGQRPPWWALTVALLVPLPAVALFIGWSHQI